MINFIDDFARQVEQAWHMTASLALPSYYIKIKNIVICGMGGSGLGADVISRLQQRLQKPLTVIHDYEISQFVDNETLVMVFSFSGNTEETVSAYREAMKKGARTLIVSTGGALVDLAKKDGVPSLVYQYGSPPRYAIGFTFSALLAILNKLGILDISPNQIKEAILLLQAWSKKLQVDVPQSKNSAKQLAQKMVDRMPVIVGLSELAGVAQIWKTLLNETAKTIAYTEELPNANHSSVTGTKYPKKIAEKLFFIIIQSKYCSPRLKIQENLFMQALDKSGINYEAVFMHPTNDSISEIFLNILFAEYVVYYLAILNKVNPHLTPLQDFIKQTLMIKE